MLYRDINGLVILIYLIASLFCVVDPVLANFLYLVESTFIPEGRILYVFCEA